MFVKSDVELDKCLTKNRPCLDWLAQSLYKQVYYRDWHHSIGSVLKILFFYWFMALRPKYAELMNLWGVLNIFIFGCQDEVEFKW